MTDNPSTKTMNLRGQVLISCNCDFGCPCNFNARPTHGNCEGGWTWHVERGSVAGVALDGLNFSIYVKWPGAIHDGKGEGVILVDERADARQRDAVATLMRGEAGGPWGVLAWTWPTVHGPVPVPYEVTFDGLQTRLKAGHAVELEFATIKNPVNGKEAHPGIVLPEGLIVKKADLGTSTVFRVGEGVVMDHSGKYTAIGPFDYAFP